MYNKIDLAILAGGNATRMGFHKGNLTIGDKTFVDNIIHTIGDRFDNVNVIDNGQQANRILGVNYYSDPLKTKQKSALLGIYSALYYSENPQTFIIGCDTPLVNPEIIDYIITQRHKGDIVICMGGGMFQPLYGIYNKIILPRVKECLLQDLHKILILYEEFDTFYIPEEELQAIDPKMEFVKNFNTYEDYVEFFKSK